MNYLNNWWLRVQIKVSHMEKNLFFNGWTNAFYTHKLKENMIQALSAMQHNFASIIHPKFNLTGPFHFC